MLLRLFPPTLNPGTPAVWEHLAVLEGNSRRSWHRSRTCALLPMRFPLNCIGMCDVSKPQYVDENEGGWGSNKDLLERFQVCPLLFRQRMGAAGTAGSGHLPSKRPVYRYIFSCPGKAQAQVCMHTPVFLQEGVC